MKIERGKSKDRILSLGWEEYLTGEVSKVLGMGTTTTSSALRELEADGYMTRVYIDGRRYIYYPTGKEVEYYEESGERGPHETAQDKFTKLNTKWLTTPMIGGRV